MAAHRRRKKRDQTRAAAAGAAAGTVSTWVTRPGSSECRSIPTAEVSEVLRGDGIIVWLDIQDPGEADLEMLREEFGFHRLALEDAAKQQQRPKIDEYPDYFFVVMYAPASDPAAHDIETEEIDVFVGRNYVVTLHRGELPALKDAVARWEKTDPELRGQVGFLLHTVTDSVIDAYFPIVDGIEDRLDDLELSLFSKTSRFDAEELLSTKRNLYTLRKAIYPLREVFNVLLRRDQAIFTAATYPYFQDSYDHVLRLLDSVDIERDMATGALEAQLSIVSNRLNETMKRLTVVAICVAIMGAVFGAWGMNFDEVPLHRLGMLGFYIIFAGTLLIVAVALIFAKRFKLW